MQSNQKLLPIYLGAKSSQEIRSNTKNGGTEVNAVEHEAVPCTVQQICQTLTDTTHAYLTIPSIYGKFSGPPNPPANLSPKITSPTASLS